MVRSRVSGIAERYRMLTLLTAGQTVLIFAAIPAVALVGSTAAVYSGVCASLLVGSTIAAAVWKEDSWHALKYAAYPPASLFALTDRTADALETSDFDAVAAALLPDDDARELLRRTYRSSCFGPEPQDRERIEARIEDLVRLRGWNAETITADPEPSTGNAISFCPCCEAEFIIAEGECCDCPGVTLHPFTARRAPESV
jgi:hypothetical protein